MSGNAKFVALLIVFIVMLGAFCGCAAGGSNGDDKINATVILVLEDQSEVKYDLNVASGSTLRSALYEAKLISEETYGAMFVEDIDGHVADVESDGCTWMPCDKDGKQIQGSFDDIVLKDSETIYLKYFVVPDFD